MNTLCRYSVLGLVMSVCAGCVDNDYDLSDVDTTVRVDVDQLVVPVNIDEITLGNILDLKESDSIKVVDGKYAISYRGEFSSDVINVPSIRLSSPDIKASETTVTLLPSGSRAAGSFTYNLANSGTPSDFSYNSDFVSEFIVSINELGCSITLGMDISLKGIESMVNRVRFSDVVLQMPKGLKLTSAEGGEYDPVSGELTLPSRTVQGSTLSLSLSASAVNFPQAGGTYTDGKVSITGNMYVKSGSATIELADIRPGTSSLPSSVTLRSEFSLSDGTVTSFSGYVRYKVDNARLSEVDLSYLPEVLRQSSTDIRLVNPVIYLQIQNPLQAYGMYARTGLDIMAYRGADAVSFPIDNPWFQIGPENPSGIYNFYLSPQKVDAVDAAYAGAVHVPFDALSNVLSGSGMPDRLSFELDNPNVPAQLVEDFRLGSDIGALKGKYHLMAPLQFGEGSKIVYGDKIDGWGSEDLDYLTVTQLEVSMTVTTDIPVGVKFTGYPIDAEGNRIGTVDLVGADVEANADGQKVVIRATGEITKLDGIEFEAVAHSASGGQALSPDMTLRLTDIRPKVSGYYTKEL